MILHIVHQCFGIINRIDSVVSLVYKILTR
jgi:hypothetical protein